MLTARRSSVCLLLCAMLRAHLVRHRGRFRCLERAAGCRCRRAESTGRRGASFPKCRSLGLHGIDFDSLRRVCLPMCSIAVQDSKGMEGGPSRPAPMGEECICGMHGLIIWMPDYRFPIRTCSPTNYYVLTLTLTSSCILAVGFLIACPCVLSTRTDANYLCRPAL